MSLHRSSTVVCEASSFQLEDSSAFAPEAAVLLNLSPDHLDRHSSYEDYVAAKLRIFANQGNDDIAVAPDDLGLEDLGGCARRVLFGVGPDAELSARAGYLWWDRQPLIALADLPLAGEHNAQNAMAAAAVCLARGLELDAVAEGLRTFAGVAHRLEPVGERGGVRYVNDSKATNVASTIVALRAFAGGVHLIAGGRGKRQDFRPLAPLVAERCTAVYLIGEAAPELAPALDGSGVALFDVGDLEHAVARCAAAARPGEIVLLSPACASFDQYRDFEARGDHFRALVGGALMASAGAAGERGRGRRRRPAREPRGAGRRRPASREPGCRPSARGIAPRAAAARAPDPDDGDALPAGVRRGDGL